MRISLDGWLRAPWVKVFGGWTMRLAVAMMVVAVTTTTWAERVVLEGILVRVNDRIVTVSDFEERVRQELTQMPNPPSGEQLRQFANALYEELVNELVLLERAAEKRLDVDSSQIDAAIANLRTENNLQEEEAWQNALKSSGLTEDQLRERYGRSMLLQRAVQGEVRPIEITEEELRREFEKEKDRYRVPAKVELEQVFLPEAEDGSDRNQLERRARGMVERVREGADMKAEATLAGASLQELGEIPIADCRADLTDALEDLDEGGLTDPISVPGGIQIIRLVRRIPEGYQPFDEVKDEIHRRKSNESYENQTRGLVEKLKQEYLVEVYPERLE
ncbi:MAG: peptidyl-prolyl cis-trans isomerase, partial [Thermoanaerobaculales bacterium]